MCCRGDTFCLEEFGNGDKGESLLLQLRNQHLEGFDGVVVSCEIVEKDDVSVLDCGDECVVSCLCRNGRYPVFAAYTADECVADGLMHERIVVDIWGTEKPRTCACVLFDKFVSPSYFFRGLLFCQLCHLHMSEGMVLYFASK